MEIVAPTLATLGGSWNLFQDGTTCTGEEFSVLPMEIEDVASGEFLLRIGEAPSAFEFSGVQVEDSLVVSGVSTVDGVTLSIDSAEWLIAPNESKLAGALTATRTENGVDCAFAGDVEAFLTDATQTSLVRGDWEWTLTTLTTTGSCATQGEVRVLPATIWPKRQNQFIVELTLEDSQRVQFDGALTGARLDIGGTETLTNGDEFHIFSDSSLTIAPGGVGAAGTIHAEIVGSGICEYTASVVGVRPALGEPLVPFIRDVEGVQALMGIAPDDPAAPVTLLESLGSEALGVGATQLAVQRIAEVVERSVLDALTSTTVSTVRDGLVYTAGGDIFWVDLAQRFDADGERVMGAPILVFEGNGAPIRELDVFVDLARTTTVIVGDRTSDQVMIELHAIEEVTASVLVTGATDFLGMIMDAMGSYRGMATLGNVAGDLRRLSVDQSSELYATGVLAAALSPRGALYFVEPEELYALDAGVSVPILLESTAGGSYSLGGFDGERIFVGRDDPMSAAILGREPLAPATLLGQTSSVGAGGAAFSNLVSVGDRVIFTMIGGSGTRRLMALPKAGGTFELLISAPESANYSPAIAQVLGDRAYFTALPISTFSVFGLDPTGAVSPEELFDHRLGQPVLEDQYSLLAGRATAGLTLLSESGDVRLLQRGDPTNAALSAADLVYGVVTPGATVTVVTSGARLLVADESTTQPGDQSAELYWVDTSATVGPVLVSGEAGELNLPID
ncbi:MAG: hypothetical protein ACJAZN_003779 [Planctomycetota bacterium]|jgi:hypothetical protein